MKRLLTILFIVSFLSCTDRKQEKPLLVDVTGDIVIPKHYIVPKTEDSLIIDGRASEPGWNSSTFTDEFIDIEGVKEPKYKTRIKMLWDHTHLYVYAEMEEPHIWGDLKQRDTVIFYNNDFEVFIDPINSGEAYGEIEINALNTLWDLYLNKPYRVGGKADNSWDLEDLKSAVNVHGTLNNPKDIDSMWTLEIAIPLQKFIAMNTEQGDIPKEGEQWRINFSRVQWDHEIIDGSYRRKQENGEYLKEYNWVWSNQKVINMHEPEKWGFLQFTESVNSENVLFIEDQDLLIKQAAYDLFRSTRFGDMKYLSDHETGFIQNIKVTYGDTKPCDATFERTGSGFKYELKSPITNNIYTINEQGILKTL